MIARSLLYLMIVGLLAQTASAQYRVTITQKIESAPQLDLKPRRNVIKTDLTSVLTGNYGLFYHRQAYSFLSFQIGGGIRHKSYAPIYEYISENVFFSQNSIWFPPDADSHGHWWDFSAIFNFLGDELSEILGLLVSVSRHSAPFNSAMPFARTYSDAVGLYVITQFDSNDLVLHTFDLGIALNSIKGMAHDGDLMFFVRFRYKLGLAF
jgi:hypothetical protein